MAAGEQHSPLNTNFSAFILTQLFRTYRASG